MEQSCQQRHAYIGVQDVTYPTHLPTCWVNDSGSKLTVLLTKGICTRVYVVFSDVHWVQSSSFRISITVEAVLAYQIFWWRRSKLDNKSKIHYEF